MDAIQPNKWGEWEKKKTIYEADNEFNESLFHCRMNNGQTEMRTTRWFFVFEILMFVLLEIRLPPRTMRWELWNLIRIAATCKNAIIVKSVNSQRSVSGDNKRLLLPFPCPVPGPAWLRNSVEKGSTWWFESRKVDPKPGVSLAPKIKFHLFRGVINRQIRA